MELVPQSLAVLIRRAERELAAAKAIFDLPQNKWWKGTPAGIDFSRAFHGEKAANVVGPAAGPHTQLAQNIALSYLSGARILELKTVQILDELKIPRPCIDVTNIGFNVEWSQELRVEQSRDEYAKSALLVAALKRLGAVDEPYLLDLSLGYDLAGISSEKITTFVRDMLDASKTIDCLLSELPPDLAKYRDLKVNPKLISCVTLSTFHGCPSHEIEKIARYLLEEFGLHVVVKLNPTLLGFETVQSLLHDRLGYRELSVRKETFEKDLQWNDALAMIARLRSTAHERGLIFGVKMTNTLVVDNFKDFFTEKEMYLSGQPLHVLSSQLLAKVRTALPVIGPNGEPPVVYSFSAGIDQHNFALAAAADLCPVTTCSDLLRPGGYARLPKYLENLSSAMKKVGAADLDAYILRAHGAAVEAAVGTGVSPEAAAQVFAGRDPREAGVDSRALALWVYRAGTINTEKFAAAALEDSRYRKEANTKVPKKIGSHLHLFDCVNCDKCIPVCPNDANFAYDAVPLSATAKTWSLENGQIAESAALPFVIGETHQLATYVDFCNGCGNCDVFCPEDGGPYVMKPHWFGGPTSFAAEKHLDGFYLESAHTIAGRYQGKAVRLSIDRAPAIADFENEELKARIHVARGGLVLLGMEAKAPNTRVELRGGEVLVLLALLDGVQKSVNPVSAALLETATTAPVLSILNG
jgi:putative selenate reductase